MHVCLHKVRLNCASLSWVCCGFVKLSPYFFSQKKSRVIGKLCTNLVQTTQTWYEPCTNSVQTQNERFGYTKSMKPENLWRNPVRTLYEPVSSRCRAISIAASTSMLFWRRLPPNEAWLLVLRALVFRSHWRKPVAAKVLQVAGQFPPKVFENQVLLNVLWVSVSLLEGSYCFTQGCETIALAMVDTTMQTMSHPMGSLSPPPEIAL